MTLPITVQARHIHATTLEWIHGWTVEHFDWSRRRLAKELCVEKQINQPWESEPLIRLRLTLPEELQTGGGK